MSIKLVGDQLELIEGEMRRIGFWSNQDLDYDLPESSSYMDCPSFEVWLQFVFVPNAKKAVAMRLFPSESQVGVAAMRQYDYQSIVEEALPLVQMLHEFDRLVNQLPNKSLERTP